MPDPIELHHRAYCVPQLSATTLIVYRLLYDQTVTKKRIERAGRPSFCTGYSMIKQSRKIESSGTTLIVYRVLYDHTVTNERIERAGVDSGRPQPLPG